MTGMPALVPCLTAPLPDAKELLAACHAADIPAELAADPCCSKGGGCAPKVQLLVPPEDVPRVASLLQERWEAMVAREGIEPEGAALAEGEHAPCPACGTAAALVEGACSDCGLQLE
jgi:hypothetical protein